MPYFIVSTLVKLTGRKQAIRLLGSPLTSVVLFLKKTSLPFLIQGERGGESLPGLILSQTKGFCYKGRGLLKPALIIEVDVNLVVETRAYTSQ